MTVAETGQPAVETPEVSAEQSAALPQESASSEPQKVEEAPVKEKNPVQDRINQLNRQRREAERRADSMAFEQQRIAQENRQLREQYAELQRKATTPRFEQYGDLDRYQQAMETHNEQAINQQRQQWTAQQQAQQQAIAEQQFQARLAGYVAEGVQKFPDFEEVVSNPSLPNLSAVNRPVLNAILKDPRLAYYLGKNPSEAHSIAAMPPEEALMEVGKLAAKVANTRQTSSAPPPVTPIEERTRATPKDPRQMTREEYWDYINRPKKRR